MRSWLALCAGVIVGCAPAETPLTIGRLRQAAPGTEVSSGDPGALLGSSLAVCQGGGFVAGAPGVGTAFLSTIGSILPAAGYGLGRAVACVGSSSSGSPLVLAGGDAGVWSASASTWVHAFSNGDITSMSRSDDPQLPLLVGSGSAVKFYNPVSGQGLGNVIGTTGLGSVVLWFPGASRRFVVTNALGSSVQIYDFNPANGSVTPGPNLLQTAPGFGKSLAVGNLFATPGLEIAVGANGANGAVYVFSESGALLTRLTGIDSSFGSSLTIQRGVGPDLDALVVGEPDLDLVHRFLGDAGAVFTSIAAGNSEKFGTSLAIDQLNVLAIGAPGRGIGGAVYFEILPVSSRLGDKQECTVGQLCTGLTSCAPGDCIGGTFCDTGFTHVACPVGQVCRTGNCVPDTGTNEDGGRPIDDGGAVFDGGNIPSVDAGRDAGPLSDAGIDAGEDAGAEDGGAEDAGADDAGFDGGKPERMDAGTDDVDAGVMYFTTRGCSGAPGLSMGLLGLLLLRRRARR